MDRRLPWRNAAPPRAYVDLDVDIEFDAFSARRFGKCWDLRSMIDTNADPRTLGQPSQAGEFLPPDHLVRDEHVLDAALDHCFGFGHLLAAHAHRSGLDLSEC